MIHLYFKAKNAKSLEEIIHVAQQEHDYLIHNDTKLVSPFFQVDFKYYTVFLESFSILNQSSIRKETISPFDILFSFIGNPFYAFLKPGKKNLKYRCFLSGIVQSAPWAKCIDMAIGSKFNISAKYSDLIVIGSGSLYQALGSLVENQNKSILNTFFDFVISILQFFSINYCAHSLSHALEKKAKIIPNFAIRFLVNALFTTPLTRHFTSKGIKSLCYSIFFSLVKKRTRALDFELPDDCVVPNELKCLICYDLLNDPVQCQGQVVCKSCLQRWINSSHGYQNPITGRDFSLDEVSKEYVFDVLSQQYLKYVLGVK